MKKGRKRHQTLERVAPVKEDDRIGELATRGGKKKGKATGKEKKTSRSLGGNQTSRLSRGGKKEAGIVLGINDESQRGGGGGKATTSEGRDRARCQKKPRSVLGGGKNGQGGDCI